MNTGKIFGIIAASVISVGILGTGIYLTFFYKKKSTTKKDATKKDDTKNTTPFSTVLDSWTFELQDVKAKVDTTAFVVKFKVPANATTKTARLDFYPQTEQTKIFKKGDFIGSVQTGDDKLGYTIIQNTVKLAQGNLLGVSQIVTLFKVKTANLEKL